MTDIERRIEQAIDAKHHEDAFLLAEREIAAGRSTAMLLRCVRRIADEVRSECIDLASCKRDVGDAYSSKEALVRQASLVLGEDVYGRPLAGS